MKDFIKALLLLIAPLFMWLSFVYMGYGPQSLTNMIEIPIVIVGSIIIAGFLYKQSTYKIFGAIFLFVFILRTIMPQIPE